MFSLKIGKDWVVLPANTKVRVDLLSPLFETEVIPGSVVMDLDIPAKPNAHIFGNTHLLMVNRTYLKYDCTVYIADQPFCKGKVIAKPKGDVFACGIVLNTFAVDFASRLLSAFDYGDPEVIGGAPHNATNVAYFAENVNKSITVRPYKFPALYDEDLYGDANKDFGGDPGDGKKGPVANLQINAGQFPVNTNHMDVLKANNVYTLIPMPELHHIVRKVINGAGMQATGAFFSDQELKKALMVNFATLDDKIEYYYKAHSVTGVETSLASGVTGTVLFTVIDQDTRGYNTAGKYTIKNAGLHKCKLSYDVRMNTVYYAPWRYRFRTYIDIAGYASQGAIWLLDIAPDINVFQHQSGDFEFTAAVGDIGKVVTVKGLFESYTNGNWSNNAGIFKNVELTVSNTNEADINQFSNTIDLKNHVPPDLTAGSLLRILRNGMGLAIWFDALQSEIQVNFINDILDSREFIDLTDKAVSSVNNPIETNNITYTLKMDGDTTPDEAQAYDMMGDYLTYDQLPLPTTTGKLARVLNEGKFYIYKKDTMTDDLGVSTEVTKWWYYREDFAGVSVGEGDDGEDVDLGLSGLSCLNYNGRLCLWSKIKATSPAFATGKNTYGLQLAFWQGMIEDPAHNTYGCATPFQILADGTIAGDQSISLHEPGNLIDLRLKRWYQYLSSCEEITQMFWLTVKDMLDIIELFSAQHGTNRRKIRMGPINYIPKRFSFNLDINKKFIETEAVLVKDGGVKL